MSMKRRALAVVVLGMVVIDFVGYATGCNGHVDSASTGANASDAATASADVDSSDVSQPASADGPYRITCSVFHRDLNAGATEHQRTPIIFTTDKLETQSI